MFWRKRRPETPAGNDDVLSSLKPGSLVINATGLGKDAPGSPLTVGVKADRLVDLNAGETRMLANGMEITAFPACHEVLQRDAAGNHHFVGYGIQWQGVRLYYSGDTIPFDAQAGNLIDYQPHLALLPVNGRDAYRQQNGVPGNLTLKESIDLCRKVGIATMIAHHFGMFDFNTIPATEIDEAAEAVPFTLLRAQLAMEYEITKSISAVRGQTSSQQ